MEIAVGAVLVVVALLMWNGLRPPGASVKSSLERERRRRERSQDDHPLKLLLLLALPSMAMALRDFEAFAAPLL
jgi:hypothetical protein